MRPSHEDSTLLALATDQTKSKRTAVKGMYFGDALIGLTLELSGGEAVRLERIVRPH
jgi:hypothetical protein